MAKHSRNLALILLLLIVSPVMVSAEQKAYPWVGILVVVISLVVLVISVVVLIIINIPACCGGGATTDDHQPQPLEAARGLDAKTIAALPTLQFSEIKMRRVGQGELECAVCLYEFQDEERLCLLPNCCHVFHPHCIAPWLSSHATCPVCRACFECGLELGSGVGMSSLQDHDVVEIEGSSGQVNHSCTKLPKCHSTGQLQSRVLGGMISSPMGFNYEMSRKSDYRVNTCNL